MTVWMLREGVEIYGGYYAIHQSIMFADRDDPAIRLSSHQIGHRADAGGRRSHFHRSCRGRCGTWDDRRGRRHCRHIAILGSVEFGLDEYHSTSDLPESHCG
jgi:hypothetical protein